MMLETRPLSAALGVEVDLELSAPLQPGTVDELQQAEDPAERTQVLLRCLERICAGQRGLLRRQGLRVSESEMTGLRYLIVRDKEGLGFIEPLIQDPYIEDIACNGVGPLFVEHKIFGGGSRPPSHLRLRRSWTAS